MIELTKAEIELIEQIRQLEWGKIEVTVQDGNPVMIAVKRNIKLNISLTMKK